MTQGDEFPVTLDDLPPCHFCPELSVSGYRKGGKPMIWLCKEHYHRCLSKIPSEYTAQRRIIRTAFFLGWFTGAVCVTLIGLAVKVAIALSR